ncbi:MULTISPECIES: hypothetical protein [unclassified Yoonia]|uniref:hypothetical protein n=1 Tax=unclassified Yoonia TaxID=2629118 RepID=UPI00372A6F65
MVTTEDDQAYSQRLRNVQRDYQFWLNKAREQVHANFGGSEAELQHLTIQAAHSLMMEHKLGEIEASLVEIKTALKTSTES